MLPYEMIAGGRFSLTTALIASGVDVKVNSQNPPDYILMQSVGNAAATAGWGEANDAQAIQFWWEKSMNQGTAKGLLQSSAAANAPAITSAFVATNGIFTYDTANPPTFAGLAGTVISGIAGTFVVTMANTGTISVGDTVRLTNVTGEQQIAGYPFGVTAVTANTNITLGYMASSGMTFAADASAVTVTKYIPNRFYPKERRIVNITKATQAVVSFAQTNNFTVGENISFRVPSSMWGMTEINNKTARVLSVTNSATVSSITLDLDTSGYTTFTFPTSAQTVAGAAGPAVAIPASSGVIPFNGSATIAQEPPGTNLLDSFDNRNVRLIHFGPGLFNIASFTSDAEDIWMWQAFKYSDYQQSNLPST